MSEERKKIYFNEKQIECNAIGAHTTVVIAGRGFGKSEGIDATHLLRNVQNMPRGTHAILSPTYKKILQNTLPAACAGLARLGYIKGVHFFIGRRAPDSMNFATPLYEPYDWGNFMHWYNGSVCQLVSFDVPMSLNSKTIDSVLGFEAKFLDYKKITTEVLQANRGNRNYFGECPWHHGIMYTSDMPTNKTGEWLLGYKQKMDPVLIDLLKQLIYDREVYRKESTAIGKEGRLKELTHDINELRKQAIFYAEYSALDNIDILGAKWIADMKRNLPPITFLTSILNKRISKLEGGFYASMDSRIHYYEAIDNSNISKIGYDFHKFNHNEHSDCRYDSDISEDKPLYIACDYNAKINWMAVGQPDYDRRELRTVKSFYVKNERKLRELCKDFNNYYRFRHNKDIVYYYNSTAVKSAYADEKAEAFFQLIINVLTDLGWNIQAVYMGKQAPHDLKHQYLDDAFKGIKYLMPRFNKYNNEELIQAMEQTDIKQGPKGAVKDKSGEKLAETEDDPLELRTDGTDAFDDLWWGCNMFPTSGGGVSFPSCW